MFIENERLGFFNSVGVTSKDDHEAPTELRQMVSRIYYKHATPTELNDY